MLDEIKKGQPNSKHTMLEYMYRQGKPSGTISKKELEVAHRRNDICLKG